MIKRRNHEVEKSVDFYNLDMIIAVGYRVSSSKATKFRQWQPRLKRPERPKNRHPQRRQYSFGSTPVLLIKYSSTSEEVLEWIL
ncbi:MAG: virulence RhuM family protein [Bacteroidaceae bacterium]|nr:virulence RhuM family protein [Bacteroidaceae bacterium]